MTEKARVLAQQVATAVLHAAGLSDRHVHEVVAQESARILDDVARAERHACVLMCKRRQALWNATADRPETVGPLRREAQCRANEAAYLADMIASDAPGAPDVCGTDTT